MVAVPPVFRTQIDREQVHEASLLCRRQVKRLLDDGSPLGMVRPAACLETMHGKGIVEIAVQEFEHEITGLEIERAVVVGKIEAKLRVRNAQGAMPPKRVYFRAGREWSAATRAYAVRRFLPARRLGMQQ